jgi:hypothetical protein
MADESWLGLLLKALDADLAVTATLVSLSFWTLLALGWRFGTFRSRVHIHGIAGWSAGHAGWSANLTWLFYVDGVSPLRLIGHPWFRLAYLLVSCVFGAVLLATPLAMSRTSERDPDEVFRARYARSMVAVVAANLVLIAVLVALDRTWLP